MTVMQDQIIDAEMAQSLQVDAAKSNVLFAWIVMQDPPEHPDRFVARLTTSHPTVYVLVADTLAEVQAMIPPGLERLERQWADPPEVVEIWFST